MMDIHNHERKYLAAREKIKNSKFSNRNKQLILGCIDDFVLDNLSKPRLIRYMVVLGLLVKDLSKDLDKVTINDLKSFVAKLHEKNYSSWTRKTYKVIIRKFYKWHYGTEGKDYPDLVKWISSICY